MKINNNAIFKIINRILTFDYSDARQSKLPQNKPNILKALLLSVILILKISGSDDAPAAPPIEIPEEATGLLSDLPNWPEGISVQIGSDIMAKSQAQMNVSADPFVVFGQRITLIFPNKKTVIFQSEEYNEWKAKNFKGEPEEKKKEKTKKEPKIGPAPTPSQSEGKTPKPIQPGDEEKVFTIAIRNLKSRLKQLNDPKTNIKDKIDAIQEIKENFNIINQKDFPNLISKLGIDIPEEINGIEKIKAVIAHHEEKISKEKEQQEKFAKEKQELDFKNNLDKLTAQIEKIKSMGILKDKDVALKEVKNIFAKLNPKEFQTLVTKLNINLPAEIASIEKIKEFIANNEEKIKEEQKLKALEQAKKLIPQVKKDIITLINNSVFQKEKLEPIDKQALNTFLTNINAKLKSMKNVIDDNFYINLEPKLGITDKASFDSWLAKQRVKVELPKQDDVSRLNNILANELFEKKGKTTDKERFDIENFLNFLETEIKKKSFTENILPNLKINLVELEKWIAKQRSKFTKLSMFEMMILGKKVKDDEKREIEEKKNIDKKGEKGALTADLTNVENLLSLSASLNILERK